MNEAVAEIETEDAGEEKKPTKRIEKCANCGSTNLWQGLWAMRNFRLFPFGFGRGLGGVLADFTICMICSNTHIHFGDKEMVKIKRWRQQEASEDTTKVKRRR